MAFFLLKKFESTASLVRGKIGPRVLGGAGGCRRESESARSRRTMANPALENGIRREPAVQGLHVKVRSHEVFMSRCQGRMDRKRLLLLFMLEIL